MRFAFTILAVIMSTQSLTANCSPKHALHIVSQLEGPGIKPGTFASLPKVIFRLGSKYARIEEAADRENGIHGLIVINEPDSWIVNLADGTGRHVVDRGQTTNVHVQAFPPGSFGEAFPRQLEAIELGCESEFFAFYHSPMTPLVSGSEKKVKQVVGTSEWTLYLVRPNESSPPEVLAVLHGNEVVSLVRYLTYEELSSDDLTLFEKPGGIHFVETGN